MLFFLKNPEMSSTLIIMFLEHQISILQWFLNHVAAENSAAITWIKYILNQIIATFVT